MWRTSILLLLISAASASAEKVETSEQLDPSVYLRSGMGGTNGMYGNQFGMGGMNGLYNQYNPMMQSQFAFTCKCSSKIPNVFAPSPTDANAAAQQQIQQLQEQVRKLTEQVNRQSIAKSGFEQFTSLIAMAQAMDCSCTGNSQDPFSAMMGGGMNGMMGNSIERFPQTFPGHFAQTMSGALGGTGMYPGTGAQLGGVPIATAAIPISTGGYRFPYKDRK